jgi:Xaa-Pro aminopeptidase
MLQLITHSTNLRYLIGFTGSSGFLLINKDKAFFFTDFRYREIAQKLEKSKTRIPFQFIEMEEDFMKDLKKVAGRHSEIQFESAHLTVDQLQSWKKRLKKASGKTHKWAPIKNTIEDKRLIKDKDEIKLMKQSQKINAKTLSRVKNLLKPGVTELQIAWQIKAIGHELGAEDISFEPIVGFGPHSAIPHHQNTSKKLKKSDIVLIDMGMKYKGYCSDMTRTMLPKKPTSRQINVYKKVLDAQLAAIKALKAGVKTATLDKIARQTMGEDAQHFGHSLGHGIGLDVHESPGLSSRSKDTLQAGMVVTVEPGIYLPGEFGVRIEDTGLVTEKGYDNFMKGVVK